MILHGTVRSVASGMAEIELDSAPCEGCRTPCAACGQNKKPRFATVKTAYPVTPGERVELVCRDKSVLFSSIVLFLIPLIAGIVTVLCCLPLGETNASLFGLLALAVSFLVCAVILSGAKQKQKSALKLREPKKSVDQSENLLDK